MKRLITLALTCLILFIIFRMIDVKSFAQAIAHPSWPHLIIALLFFIPLIGLTAWRWQVLVHKSCHCSFLESVKLLMASSTLNLVLPSKIGDLAKAVFLRNTGKVDMSRGFNIVIFEKLMDLSALGLVFLTGFLIHRAMAVNPENIIQKADFVCFAFVVFVITVTCFIYFIPLRLLPGYPALIRWLESKKGFNRVGHFLEDGQHLMGLIRENNRQIITIVISSFVLWFMHMTQVYFFFRAVELAPSLPAVYHWAPMAILVGLIPVTISGIGIRDGSFMYLFSAYGSQALIFAASVLVTLRYLLPGLLGTFFLNQYMVRESIPKKEM